MQNEVDLVWSYMLDYENINNRHYQKRIAIQRWQGLSIIDIDETPDIVKLSKCIQQTGIKSADSIHIACAICAGCDYFITTDKRAMKYNDKRINVCDPINFLRIWEEMQHDE